MDKFVTETKPKMFGYHKLGIEIYEKKGIAYCSFSILDKGNRHFYSPMVDMVLLSPDERKRFCFMLNEFTIQMHSQNSEDGTKKLLEDIDKFFVEYEKYFYTTKSISTLLFHFNTKLLDLYKQVDMKVEIVEPYFTKDRLTQKNTKISYVNINIFHTLLKDEVDTLLEKLDGKIKARKLLEFLNKFTSPKFDIWFKDDIVGSSLVYGKWKIALIQENLITGLLEPVNDTLYLEKEANDQV